MLKNHQNIDFKRTEIVFHILFWCAYLIYPLLKFGDHQNFEFDFEGGITNLILIAISVYTTYFLYNRLLKNKFLIVVILSVFLISVILSCLLQTQDCNCSIKVCYFNKFVEYVFINIYFISLVIFKNYMLSQQALQKSEKERISAELKGLKAQINPHFLFNTLNMLYANAIAKDENLPDRILQLSDNLHYMLHEGGKNEVSIIKEINFIEDYISLQIARTGKKNNVKFKNTIDNPNQLIPPLLLIPFIENAFKYSSMSKGKNLPITIHIKLLNKTLSFLVTNNYDPNYIHKQMETWKGSGIGIENTRKRLSILFSNKHTLTINSEENVFIINLKIDLK